MLHSTVDVLCAPVPVRASGAPTGLSRRRYQLILGLLFAIIIPAGIYHSGDLKVALERPPSINTEIGAAIAFLISHYLYRRVVTFPGVGLFGFIMPAVAAGYGIVLAVFFATRLEYSRLNLGISFVLAVTFLFLLSMHLRKHARQSFYVIPSEHALGLATLPGADWNILSAPELPREPGAVLIADLRADMDDDWERLIAQAALSGLPVYHSKQVQESLTGKVEIEHLSENSFGSLIPNSSYRKLKRLIDVLFSLALLPVLATMCLVVAVLIKLDSPGPIFFRQVRRGYRGRIFQVLKFRTMTHDLGIVGGCERNAAITKTDDPRITKFGQFLRRTRIDELPQVWNVLRGEMSWIGPRPEAIPLSEWYMGELPFYAYRHILRPGVTGWAQVNQGHVADLEGVNEKLHYDFFYIKHFSAWMDLLILWRTIGIVFSGYGAK
jgi:lipopolysaccharide/colanic/teichoic acid biosynthesis glycosyltransferase